MIKQQFGNGVLEAAPSPFCFYINDLIFSTASIGRLLIFKAIMELGERDKNRTNLNTINLIVLTQIWSFFLTKHSLDCYKLLLNFQSSEKCIYTTCSHYFFLSSSFSSSSVFFLFSSKFCLFYLKIRVIVREKGREREMKRERNLLSIGSLPKWPQQPELGWSEARTQGLLPGPGGYRDLRGLGYFPLLSKAISRLLDLKQNSWDSNRAYMGCWYYRQRINLTYYGTNKCVHYSYEEIYFLRFLFHHSRYYFSFCYC